MSLVPLDGVAGVVAKIAKSDPETARMFAQLGLYEVLSDIIDVYRDELDETVVKVLGRSADQARRELVRDFVEARIAGLPVEPVLKAAREIDALDTKIAKAAGDYVEREHRRDPYTGRWVTMVNAPEGASLQDRSAAAAKILEEYRNSGLLRAGNHVVMTNEVGAERDHTVRSNALADASDLVNAQHAAHTVEVDPEHTSRSTGPERSDYDTQASLFDAMEYATGRDPVAAARRTPSAAGFNAGLTDLVTPGDHPAFRTLRAGGAALQAVSVPGSGSYAAGAVAQLGGHLGPEAQRILGPGFARLSYKYRGTERTPDVNLVADVRRATGFADRAAQPTEIPDETGRPVPNPRALPNTNPLFLTSLGSAQRAAADPELTADQRRLLVRGDAAVGYFIDQMPDMKQADLSIAAGRVPPSVGAIIDADGQVVSEAMGTGDDHYLPFDLKNLKELAGGQYVRTRLAGGPTTEDIYTGLLTGTRQIQVVSHSGVFTLEFDPDLRGGRRYSDKARSMVDRYQKLLEAVAGGKVEEQGISPERMSALRAEAVRLSGGEGDDFDAELAGRKFTELKETERNRQNFLTDQDEDELRAEARREAIGGGTNLDENKLRGETQVIFERKLRERQERQVRNLQLDGYGYFRAMQALKQEFPYFIRNVSWEPLQGAGGFFDTRFSYPKGTPKPALHLLRSSTRQKEGAGFVPKGMVTHWRSLAPRGERSSTAAAPREETKIEPETTSGAGNGGPAGQVRPGEPKPEAGKFAEQPSREHITVPNLSVHGATPLEGLSSVALQTRVSNALTPIANNMSKIDVGQPPSKLDLDNPEAVGDAATYVRTLMDVNKYGARGIADYFTEGLPAGAKPHDLDRFIRGLRDFDTKLTEDANHQVLPQNEQLRKDLPTEAFENAIADLKLLGKLKRPFADPSGPTHLYSPQDGDPPLRFADIAPLGNSPQRYEAFYRAAKNQRPELAQAIDRMRLMEPDKRAPDIRRQVDEYQAITAFAKKPSNSPPEAGVPARFDTPPKAARYLRDEKPEERLRTDQKAWAFVHGEEIAKGLAPPAAPGTPPAAGGAAGNGGGGGAPLAPGPAGPAQAPAPLVSTVKRLSGTPKLIVHPPGSPVAKALARARSMR